MTDLEVQAVVADALEGFAAELRASFPPKVTPFSRLRRWLASWR